MSVEKEAPARKSRFPEAGPQRFPKDEIHPFLKEQASKHLVPGANFEPAREGGQYKGPILYADDRYVVQGVGKEKNSAVVHQRSDLSPVGNRMEWLADNNKLRGQSTQIHYKAGGKNSQVAQMYPWNAEREEAERALRKAHAFAKGIGDAGEREAFLKNTEVMIRKTLGPDKDGPAQTKDKAAAEPAKAKAGKSAATKDTAAPEPKAAKPKAAKKTADKSGPER